MNTKEERRHFQRIAFHSQVVLKKKGMEVTAELLDISLKGLLVALPQGVSLTMDARLHAKIPLTGSSDAIVMECKVTHLEGNRAGLEWQEIDVDNFARLRQMLLVNMGSDALAQRELTAMIEAHRD